MENDLDSFDFPSFDTAQEDPSQGKGNGEVALISSTNCSSCCCSVCTCPNDILLGLNDFEAECSHHSSILDSGASLNEV
jgi:hypothetical protein